MLFNSYSFIFLFLPLVLTGYFFLLRRRLVLGAKIWLVSASLFFYGYWEPIYILLLLGSIFVNFFVGSALAETSQEVKQKAWDYFSRKNLLFIGIIFNLSLLGYFKYTDFFLENFNLAFSTNVPLPQIILPLGISFFTFTQIAFLVDAYKNKVKEYDLLRYMLFVTYFPHLLAGPILHHKEMMPQFSNRRNFSLRWKNIALGLSLFSIGLFKKVIVADTFSEWVALGYKASISLNLFEAWATSLSYTLQIYFDFSGYTDMAVGMSLMFNILLPINFNSPYKARNIQDFWRRWHITLSRFLRDYVYTPLGGNQVSSIRNYTNLFLVFLLGGIWHGASWMFVIWGVLHGIAIVLHRIWKNMGFKMWGWLAWFITFNFINITWIFFRAENWDKAKKILIPMFNPEHIVLHVKLEKYLFFLRGMNIEFGDMFRALGTSSVAVWIVLSTFVVLRMKNSTELSQKDTLTLKTSALGALMFLCAVVSLGKATEFLYFNF